jgi:hypothetical protein
MSMRHIDKHSTSQSAGNSQTTGTLDQSNQSAEEAVRRGQDAWARVRGDHTWEDWLRVGAALAILRTEAMHEARVNQPSGRNYNEAFGTLLQKFGFDTIDKGDRARLFEVMAKLVEIEAWRATLTQDQRVLLNHPTTVLRKFKGATAASDPVKPKTSPVAKLKQYLAILEKDNYRMRHEIERGGGDLWNKDDKPDDIAAVIVAQVSATKAERVARAILKKLRDKDGQTHTGHGHVQIATEIGGAV